MKTLTFENEDVVVDTGQVNDGFKPYETYVKHILYKPGGSLIVEAYDTPEEASKGHEKWVNILTSDPLPESLMDCGNDPINRFANTLRSNVFPLQKR